MPRSTATPETDRRFDDLEEPLAAAVVWAGLLDKIIEHDLTRYPQMSKLELHRLAEELAHVNDALKAAVHRVDNIYHKRNEEAHMSHSGSVSGGV
jgi:hypothetical protein